MSTRHRRIFVLTLVGVATYAMAFAGHASADQKHSEGSKQHGHSSANSGPGNSANAPGHTKKVVPITTKDTDKTYAAASASISKASTTKASPPTTVRASKPLSSAKSNPPAVAAKPTSPVKAQPAPASHVRAPQTQGEVLPAPTPSSPVVAPVVSNDDINNQLNVQSVDPSLTAITPAIPEIPQDTFVASTAPTSVEPIAYHANRSSFGLHPDNLSSILASIVMIIGAIAIFIVSYRHVKLTRAPKTSLSMSLAYLDDIVQLKFF